MIFATYFEPKGSSSGRQFFFLKMNI